jgi:hypothetical protein
MRVSSAYWITGKSGFAFLGKGGVITLECIALFRIVWRKSAASTNSKGERGENFGWCLPKDVMTENSCGPTILVMPPPPHTPTHPMPGKADPKGNNAPNE